VQLSVITDVASHSLNHKTGTLTPAFSLPSTPLLLYRGDQGHSRQANVYNELIIIKLHFFLVDTMVA